MEFTIPDAALGNVIMRRVRARNLKRLSPHSFAYHPQRDIFDAIIDLKSYLIDTAKVYSVQIDFKDFFDSIPTKYLISLLDRPDIMSSTEAERSAIKAFMGHQFAQRTEYALGNFERRRRGTPQGSSISLIMANMANHSLDVMLERLPGKFVRFADDVTALTSNYEDSNEIEHAFYKHSSSTGIRINKEKSPGINILDANNQEIRTVSKIDYLGYRFTKEGLRLSDKTVRRIKAKISKLVSVYLIQYIRDVSFNPTRVSTVVPTFDWDLLGLISELRNYLYGGLSEAEIGRMIRQGKKLRRMAGLMSFYCLLDDKETLVELDGWLVATVRRATRERSKIISSHFTSAAGLLPSNAELILGTWMDPAAWEGDPKPEFGLPSFVRGWRAAKKYYLTFGLEDVEPPKYSYQYSM